MVTEKTKTGSESIKGELGCGVIGLIMVIFGLMGTLIMKDLDDEATVFFIGLGSIIAIGYLIINPISIFLKNKKYKEKYSSKMNAEKDKVCSICSINLISSTSKEVFDAKMAVGLLNKRVPSSLLNDEKQVLNNVAYSCRSCRTLICKKCASINKCATCGSSVFDLI